MSTSPNYVRLAQAIGNLEWHPDADELSEAINAFGQVIADLVDKECRLAVIMGEELGVVEGLQAENAKLKTTIRLMNLDAGTLQ